MVLMVEKNINLSNLNLLGNILGNLDNGTSLLDVVKNSLVSKLGFGFTNEQEVLCLYQNIIGSTPSESIVKSFTSMIFNGQYSQAGLALFAAESDFNKANVNLIGLSQLGLSYISP
jgi:hypothetical protein